MSALECRSELMTRWRRGMCSPGEVAEAQRHLRGCSECRVSHLLDVDFEDEGALQPADDERIGRYAALAAATAGRQAKRALPKTALPRTRRSPLYLALAAALLLVGVAGAALWGRQVRVLPPSRAGLVSARPGVVSASPSMVSGAQSEAPRVSAVPAAEAVPMEEAAGEARRGGQALGHSAALSPSTEAVESAAMLFEKANGARRAGDAASAVVLYRRLQRGFPGSAETRLSRVSTGRLLLDAGAHAEALEQFDAYLRPSGGELRLEALAGRAKALGLLGRVSDERAALRRLVGEYPGSVQAQRAQTRLDSLR